MLHTLELSTPLQWQYWSKNLENKKSPLLILLHGYNQDAEWIYNDLKPALPNEAPIISIQAPFLIPPQKKEQEKPGYAWYFFDSKKKQFVYPKTTAVQGVISLMDKLQLLEREKVFVGYSMGGYLAPFLANQMSSVKKVVMVNARLRFEELENVSMAYPLTAMNGIKDSWVDFNLAKESFEKVAKNQKYFKFVSLEKTNHFVNTAILDQLLLELSEIYP